METTQALLMVSLSILSSLSMFLAIDHYRMHRRQRLGMQKITKVLEKAE